MRHAACLLIGLLAVFAPALKAATLDEILERGTLRACVALIDPRLIDKSPRDCSSDCAYSGLIIEQVTAFAQSLGNVSLDLREVGWSEQFADKDGDVDRERDDEPWLLAQGTCDLFVSNLTILDWRLRKMNIVPLFQSRMIVMVRAERASEFPDMMSLGGQTAAVLPDSSFQSWITARNGDVYSDNPIKSLPIELGETFDYVENGTADFAFSDADIAVLAMKVRARDITPAFSVGATQSIGWGMSRGAPGLRQQVKQFFEASRADPTSPVSLAWRNWLGVTIPEFEALVRSLPGDPAQDAIR